MFPLKRRPLVRAIKTAIALTVMWVPLDLLFTLGLRWMGENKLMSVLVGFAFATLITCGVAGMFPDLFVRDGNQ